MIGVQQYAWTIWRARRVFSNIGEMCQFVYNKIEEKFLRDGWCGGPEGVLICIAWNDHPKGVVLTCIIDIEPGMLYQYQHNTTAQYFYLLDSVEENYESGYFIEAL